MNKIACTPKHLPLHTQQQPVALDFTREPEAAPYSLIEQTLEVRWRRIGIDGNGPNGPLHAETAFVIHAAIESESTAEVRAWIELPGGGRRAGVSRPATCVIVRERGLVHLDCVPRGPVNGEFLLRLSMREEDNCLLFVASPLLAEAGFAGGTYDRPTMRLLSSSDIEPHISATTNGSR
jgi:hypothetical protein